VARTATNKCNGQVDQLIIYRAFIEDELDAPKHLARRVHELYFAPEHEDFQARTMWNLSNAFTSAFKELDPIPQFKATARLGPWTLDLIWSACWGPDRVRYTDLPAPAGLLNTDTGRLSSICWERADGSRWSGGFWHHSAGRRLPSLWIPSECRPYYQWDRFGFECFPSIGVNAPGTTFPKLPQQRLSIQER